MTLDDRVGFNRLNLTRNATAPGQRDLPTGSTDYVPVPVRWFLSATYRHGEYIGKPNDVRASNIGHRRTTTHWASLATCETNRRLHR
jgi:hypothetical protein